MYELRMVTRPDFFLQRGEHTKRKGHTPSVQRQPSLY